MQLGGLSYADQRWRTRCLTELPPEVAELAAAEYDAQASRPRAEFGAGSLSSVGLANQRLGATARQLGGLRFDLVESESAIRARADKMARLCQWAGGLDGMRRLAVSQGIEPPTGRHMTRVGELARLTCPRWWRRRLRAALAARAENGLRAAGYVRRGRAAYVSDFSVRRRQGQRAKNRAMLESARAVNELGEQLELFELVQASVSNPAIRRGEFMTRCRGFEDVAADLGHGAAFMTATCPSAFHPQLAAGGANPKFDVASCGTVRAAREWLQRMWARVRAKLKRLSVQFYGFRIAEPHHDGTPHWHLLLFGTAAALDTVAEVMRAAWLSEYADEPGARERRLQVKAIEAGQGSATGYVAKYVSKNLDGHEIGEDFEADTTGEEGARRVDAWASTHRIRQFQQLGGPPVGLWRELRRLREPVEAPEIEAARAAADAGDWHAFVTATGGIDAGRSGPVQVWTECTGELTGYGELRAPVPAGVTARGHRLRTRLHTWAIHWNAPAGTGAGRSLSPLGPVSITVRDRAADKGPRAPVPGGQERRRRRRPDTTGLRRASG